MPSRDELIDAIANNRCPDCGSGRGFELGPRGGAAQNIFCPNCRSGFNVVMLMNLTPAAQQAFKGAAGNNGIISVERIGKARQ